MRPVLVDFLAAGMEYDGEALASGTVETYDAGTSNPRSLYQDINKASAHTNPATLGSQGSLQAYGDGLYKFIIKDSDGNTRYTYDNVALFADDLIGSFAGATSGSSNAYTATLSPSPVELTEGLRVIIEANHTNTSTAPTFNLNSLGAVTIKRTLEEAVFPGDIINGRRYELLYDDSAWLILNPSRGVNTWTPTGTPQAGSMGTITFTLCKYSETDSKVDFQLTASWTQASASANYIDLTLPVAPSAINQSLTAIVDVAGSNVGGLAYVQSISGTGTARVYHVTGTAFGTGARFIFLSGSYYKV